MSRYGQHETLNKKPETPYPPILDFVPDPPFPSASSSLNNIKGNNDDLQTSNKWNEQSCEEVSSEASSLSDWDDKESIPDYPFNPNSVCLRSKCRNFSTYKQQSPEVDEKEDTEEEEDYEEQQGELKAKVICSKKKKVNRRLVEVESRLSDISIRDEEYERALNAGKIQVRGKGQQLYEPILGEVAPESDRIDFHFFLKKSGILSIIARSILALYDEPNLPEPQDALEYMMNAAGYKLVVRDIVKEMKSFKESLMIHYQRLSVENDWLHRALDQYEATELSLNGREPNSCNALNSARGSARAQSDKSFAQSFKDFPKPRPPSLEEQLLSIEFDGGMINLEEFDTKMKILDPNYLEFSDQSSDDEKPRQFKTSFQDEEALIFKQNHEAEILTKESSKSPIAQSHITPPHITPPEISPSQISPSQMSPSHIEGQEIKKLHPPGENKNGNTKNKGERRRSGARKLSVKADGKTNATASTKITPPKKSGRKKLPGGTASVSPDLTTPSTKGKKHETKHMHQKLLDDEEHNEHEHNEEAVLESSSCWDLHDNNYVQELNKLIAEEGSSDEEIKKIPKKWFSYDYEEDDRDYCAIGMDTSSISPRSRNSTTGIIHSAETEGDEEEDFEEIPILYDTSEDETGMENVLPQMAGHLIIQTEFSTTQNEEVSDDEKEYLNNIDYQEPDLSSDDEIFGMKHKLRKKFKILRGDHSEVDSDEELGKIVFGDEQLIDVLDMTPIVPYSSDEDELDGDTEEQRPYEFPIVKSTITPHLRHVQPSQQDIK